MAELVLISALIHLKGQKGCVGMTAKRSFFFKHVRARSKVKKIDNCVLTHRKKYKTNPFHVNM